MTRVRLDKWLWAARFFKTRSLARRAIDGGKVHVGGSRAKPSRDVQIGDELKIRQGWDERTVIVAALIEQRRSAPEARLSYEETPASIQQRASEAEQRKLAGQHIASHGRPSKKDRRVIHEFKQKQAD